MPAIPPELSQARARFLELVSDLRPDLHRYCTRLVGSAIDGEDVVQEALAKAFFALGLQAELPPLKPWLIRIAHHTAVDFLRRYDRRFVEPVAQPADLDAADAGPLPDLVRASLSSFVALPVLQRSAVILKDVLGSSLEEIAEATGTTVGGAKAALSRGRAALRAQPRLEQTAWRDLPETSPAERAVLDRYCALFNARRWEALGALLSEECRLDVLDRTARKGAAKVAPYFGNYAKVDTLLSVARAEGRAVLAARSPSGERPTYLIALECDGDRVRSIRDYRYVPYVMHELRLEEEP